MTQSYGPFASGTGANFSETQWREVLGNLFTPGVIKSAKVNGSAGGDLGVSAGSGLSVNIATGVGFVYGFGYENDATLSNQALTTADPTNPRIDRVVLKLDFTAKTVLIAIKTGTPAASPAAPSLTQTATTWEVPLYQVRVNAGATTPSTFTDERVYCGINVTALPSGATIGGFVPFTTNNDGSGSGLDADTLDGINSTGLVKNSVSGQKLWTQSSDPGGSAAEGDLWANG